MIFANEKFLVDPEEATPLSRTKARVLFDITDVLKFLENSRILTGIQRVQLEAVKAHLNNETVDVECCYFDHERIWHSVDPERFLAAFEDYSLDPENGLNAIAELRRDCLISPEVKFGDQDVLYFLGATWSMPGFFESLRSLREIGVKFAFFIHDLIPIKNSEYFDKMHAIAFSYWFNNVLFWADTLICNSEETKADIEQYTSYEGLVFVAPLNTRPPFLEPSAHSHLIDSRSILTANNLDHVPFILMVGTVEPRKNHIAAINAWSAMKTELGDACPKLVFVGKSGWKYQAIFHLIDALNRDDGIIWLESVSDAELSTLYSACKFTLYISRAEGWGLPITESLAAGKVCVTGYASGAAEACQSLTIQTDEQSERHITATLIDLVQNPERLIAAEERIRKEAKFASWAEHAQNLVKNGQLVLSAPSKSAQATLDVGVSYSFGQANAVPIGKFEITGELLRSGKNWHSPDVWGSWVSGHKSEVVFRVPQAGKYDCYIMVKAPPGGATVAANFRGKTIWQREIMSDSFIKISLGEIAVSETIEIELTSSRIADLSKDETTSDQRILGCAWRELRIVDSNDLEARIEALEHFVSL